MLEAQPATQRVERKQEPKSRVVKADRKSQDEDIDNITVTRSSDGRSHVSSQSLDDELDSFMVNKKAGKRIVRATY
jgi:hypothetical protein